LPIPRGAVFVVRRGGFETRPYNARHTQ